MNGKGRSKRPPGWQSKLRQLARVGFAVLGVAAVIVLVQRAGAAELRAVLVRGSIWLPLVLLIEAGRLVTDAIALRVGHPEQGRRVPVLVLVRAHLVGSALGAILPAGRVANEATKAAAIAPYVRGAAAAAMAADNQAWMLFANGAWSGVCAVASLVVTGASPLTLALLIHFVAVSAMGAGMRKVMCARRIGGWLGRRFQRIAGATASVQEIARSVPLLPPKPLAALIAGRVLQAIEYGVLLLAVGVSDVTAASALVAQGVTLVGSAVGSIVPGQVGAIEGSFSFFAGAIGATAAQALAVPLLARAVQLTWVVVGAAVGALWRFERAASSDQLSRSAPERDRASARSARPAT